MLKALTQTMHLLPAEQAHNMSLKLAPLGAFLSSSRQFPELETSLSSLVLPSPLGLAAGYDKNVEAPHVMQRFGFGFIECGSVTPEAQLGNAKPRLFRLKKDKSIINRMGLNNHGLEVIICRLKELRRDHKMRVPLGINLAANKSTVNTVDDYVRALPVIYNLADYVTLNISCPNQTGAAGLQNRDELMELLDRVGALKNQLEAEGVAGKPIFLKLGPDLDGIAIEEISSLVSGSFLSALIISNTLPGRPYGLSSSKAEEPGGLSGQALYEASTNVLRQFAKCLDGALPLIGVGGIHNGATAYAKIKAGATALQIYSSLVYEGPGLVEKINRQLVEMLKADGLSHISEAIGADIR